MVVDISRYCILNLSNDKKVVFDKIARKTLLVVGNFDDLCDEYENSIQLPEIVAPTFNTFVLSVTDECNLRCKYCSRYHNAYKATSMSEETMFNVISSVLEYAIRLKERCVVQFHGGEPSLRSHIISSVLCRFPKNKLSEYVDFRIQTNGTNVKQELIDLCNSYNIQVGISLDGPSDITDVLRNNNANFGVADTIIDNLAVLRKQINNLSLSCLCVITKNSINNADRIFDFICDNQIDDVSFLPLYNDYSCINDDRSIIPRNDELLSFSKKIIQKWIDALKNGREICIPNFQIWFWNIVANNTDNYYNVHSCCGVGETILFIDKDGTIYPCGPFANAPEMAYGKITKSNYPFEEIMNSQLFREISNRLPNECSECALQSICRAGCAANSYLETKSIVTKDPYCDYWKGLISYIATLLIDNPDVINIIPDYTIRL